MKIPEYIKLNNDKLPAELADVLNTEKDVWSNDACYGYCIRAMENAGYRAELIRNMIHHLHDVFENLSVDEAEKLFHNW